MCWPEFDTVSFCNCLSHVVYRISGVFPVFPERKKERHSCDIQIEKATQICIKLYFLECPTKDANRKWEKSPEWQQETYLWCTHFCCSCYNLHMLFTLTLYGVLWKHLTFSVLWKPSLAQRSHGRFMIKFWRVFECCRNAQVGWLFVKLSNSDDWKWPAKYIHCASAILLLCVHIGVLCAERPAGL